MESKAKQLIETLTNDSGRNVFTVEETLLLQEISLLEGSGEINKMNIKIKEFKKEYAVLDDEWLS